MSKKEEKFIEKLNKENEIILGFQEYEKKIADLEAKLAESEKLTERLQQIVDKLRDKEFAGKTLVEAVNAVYEPLFKNKCDEVEELKQQLHDLPKKIIRDVVDELGDCGKAYLECEPYIKICTVKSILQAILKKYGDKNESNND